MIQPFSSSLFKATDILQQRIHFSFVEDGSIFFVKQYMLRNTQTYWSISKPLKQECSRKCGIKSLQNCSTKSHSGNAKSFDLAVGSGIIIWCCIHCYIDLYTSIGERWLFQKSDTFKLNSGPYMHMPLTTRYAIYSQYTVSDHTWSMV